MTVKFEKFKEYLGGLIIEERNSFPEEFSTANVKADKLTPGSLFVAFDDEENDGLEHIQDAINAGAVAIATTEACGSLPKAAQNLGYLQINKPTLFAAKTAELFAGFPADILKLYAITGTNGKTTSAMLLHQILQQHYGAAGLISTIGCDSGGLFRQTGYTTPPPFMTQELFTDMIKHNIRAAALENSSHGLDQYRTGSAKFVAAIFTNLTGDHLDYHKNMDNYFAAKARMFTELVVPEGVAVINIDDAWGEQLATMSKAAGNRVATFGQKESADYRILNVCCSAANSSYDLQSDDQGLLHIITPLCGEHNVYNTAGVAIAAIETGIPCAEVVGALAADVQIPGRLEHLSNGRIDCYVDYAHTDDALARVLKAVKPWCRGKLIVVFGCGGDRDRSKRPRMGKVAAQLADRIVITSDNPRTEDPGKIIQDILPGIPEGIKYYVQPDRREAIKFAIVELARPGDVVIIAGKGHETYQEINAVRTHFDDREEAWRWL